MVKSIVLIPTILTVLLPSLPNGNNFNPPIQNADPISIIAWDIDDATKTSSQTLIDTTIDNENVYANISKYNINKSNDYINIKETTYTQTLQLVKTNNHKTINYYNDTTTNYETSAIIITEITTYKGITNNTIDYEISLINNNTLIDYEEIKADIIQYRTNNDLSEYINQTNYAILNNQLAIFTDITNNFSYTQTKNINDYIIQEETNISTNIQLNSIWKTYMITYIKWDQTTYEELQNLSILNPNTNQDLITMDTGEIFGIVYTPTGYEVIDIPSLMFTILTLPFSFISQAFNLTLFPNTPYSINIGNLFLSIVAIILLMWLLQKIIGFFSKS